MTKIRTAALVAAAIMLTLSACATPSTEWRKAAPSATPSDIGSGTPGAPCATNRLGKSFIKDGVTYTCGGDKPYHWRKATSTAKPTPARTAKASTTKAVSAEQRNATRAAMEYLSGQNFSRTGLIKQLKYEGYSTKSSTAAVDSLHMDWSEQAALVARNYLQSQAFSKKSLTEQLEYDGFTPSQAAYGVAHSGL